MLDATFTRDDGTGCANFSTTFQHDNFTPPWMALNASFICCEDDDTQCSLRSEEHSLSQATGKDSNDLSHSYSLPTCLEQYIHSSIEHELLEDCSMNVEDTIMADDEHEDWQ